MNDVELIGNGGFSPLTGFMNRDEYHSVIESSRLLNGSPWPIPVTLDIDEVLASSLALGGCIALHDTYSNPVAKLHITDIFTPNRTHESLTVFGHPDDITHPGIRYLFMESNLIYLGGDLVEYRGIKHPDFLPFRHTPTELHLEIVRRGNPRVIAFQTRNPLHMAHTSLILEALTSNPSALILIHPVVGTTKPDDIHYRIRVKGYIALINQGSLKQFRDRIILSLLPLAMRFAGPREALLHMIIRKNYGATDFIIGRDHAGCKRKDGSDFYSSFAAGELALEYKNEIGINILRFPEYAYFEGMGYLPVISGSSAGAKSLSGTQVRKILERGDQLPHWFSDPVVSRELLIAYPKLSSRGLVVMFVGYSGSGKTTIALDVLNAIQDGNFGHNTVTLLDGDAMRKRVSSELGFTKQDRLEHLKRMMFIAIEIASQRGLVIVSTIAPYKSSRDAFRESITYSARANFVLIHVNTTIHDCATRDTKGLYHQADSGRLSTLSGVGSPFEMLQPGEADLMINGTGGPGSVLQSTNRVIEFLIQKKFLNPISASWIPRTVSGCYTTQKSSFGLMDYQLIISLNNSTVDAVDDIPYKVDQRVFRMVIEVPQYTRAKMENHNGAIRHDLNDDGSIRFLKHPNPIPVHYGFIPQTVLDDRDPLDALDISGEERRSGEVIEVYIVGILPLVDQGVKDYKVIVIAVDSAIGRKIIKRLPHEDYNSSDELTNWFREYKVFEGKSEV